MKKLTRHHITSSDKKILMKLQKKSENGKSRSKILTSRKRIQPRTQMGIFALATNPIISPSRFPFENNSIIQFLPIFQEKIKKYIKYK